MSTRRVKPAVRALLVELAELQGRLDREGREFRRTHDYTGASEAYQVGAYQAATSYLAERIARTLGDDALADELVALSKNLDDEIRERGGRS